MISKTRGACWIDLPKKIESEKHSGESGPARCRRPICGSSVNNTKMPVSTGQAK